jgi:hypothetical protein
MMIFNFVMLNQPALALKSLTDVLLPVFRGLEAGGHHVIGYGLDMQPAPVINVLVEFFPDDAFTDTFLRLRGFRFGIFCPTEIMDDVAMQTAQYPRRRDNLLRLLKAAEFAWTPLPQVEVLAAHCPPGRTRRIDYGYVENERSHLPVLEAAHRDIDVLIYGRETPYRAAILDDLRRRGLHSIASRAGITLPGYLAGDLIRRAKLVLDVRDDADRGHTSPVSVARALHSGTAVVSERSADAAPIFRYVERVETAGLVGRCEEMVRSGGFVEIGRAAQARFRAETSMRDNMAALLPSLA